ncbi:MAG: helix-turn-helix transcriptional regulator [Nitrospira sp.]|nr:helix-turn-helix transcriptional regulator [Nitrospira sp.]MDE0403951.1 helix-turn-helix transcriptional regulator [Nitrospira sp.]MDE0487269.1 helix-turn-helix transcriptional regulator [Nitrospira sp.]
MQAFAAHLKEKLQDERFRKLYKKERQLAELSLQLVVARDKSGRSQKEVAHQAEVTQQQLSKLENGISCNVTTLLKVCNALGLKLELSDLPKFRIAPNRSSLFPGTNPEKLNQLNDQLETKAFARESST